MYPYALIDLHCDTLTDCGKGDASKSDTLEDPAKVLSLSAIPQQTHWAQFYAVFTPDQIRGQGAIDYFAANRIFQFQQDGGNEGTENDIPQKPCGRGKGFSRQSIDRKRNKIGSEKGTEACKVA